MKTFVKMLAVGGLFSVLAGLLFFPFIFCNKSVLPLDIVNTMVLPYSFGNEISVFNHFLNDITTQYFLYKKHMQMAISGFDFAYWNPYVLGGFPQYALTMAGGFDLTNAWFLVVEDTECAYVFQMCSYLVIAALGMFLFLRSYSLSVAVCAFSACAYMLNSMFMTTIYFPWIIGSFAWVPYILYMLHVSFEKRSFPSAIYGGAFLGVAMLAASMQTIAFLWCVSFLFVAVVTLYIDGWAVRQRVLYGLWVLIILYITALAVSMISLLPSLDLFLVDVSRGGFRSLGSSYTIVQRLWGLPLLISFVMPELVGSVRAFDLTKLANSTMMFFNGSIGFAPVFFAMLACRGAQRKRVLPFVVIAAVGILIPIATPWLRLVYHRFFIVYILGVTMLSAFGLSWYLDNYLSKEARDYWRFVRRIFYFLMFIFILLQLLLFVFNKEMLQAATQYIRDHMGMAQMIRGNREWYFERIPRLLKHFSISSPTMYVPLSIFIAVLLLIREFERERLRKNVFVAGLICLTVSQLLFFAWSWIPFVDKEAYPMYKDHRIIELLKADNEIFRVAIYDSDIDKHPVFSPNILSYYGIETINGYESVEPRSVRELFRGIDAYHSRMCNVKYLLTHVGTDCEKLGFKKLYGNIDGIDIYQNNSYLPRLFMRYQYKYLAENEFWDLLLRREIECDNFVYLHDNVNKYATYLEASYAVEVYDYTYNSIKAIVKSDRPGELVFCSSYYPGWKCTIDGEEVQVSKVNCAMMGVQVPEGHHDISFYFKPKLFTQAAYISLCALLFVLVVLIVEVRKKWKSH